MAEILAADAKYDLKTEINRKTIEACEALGIKSDRGEISQASLRISLQALYDATTGLIDRDITEAIEAMLASLNHARIDRDIHVFHKGDQLVITARDMGEDQFKAYKFTTSDFQAKSVSYAEEAGDGVFLAKAHCLKLEEGLSKRGYTII